MSIDSMYELAALGELLEQKRLITKQEILTLATELKHKNPPAQSFTPQDNAVIEQNMDVIELLSNVVPGALLTRRPSPWLFVRCHQ